MTRILKFKKCKAHSSASVVDGKLILSFPGAEVPVVWQMDFTQVKSSALEVVKNEDKNIWTLALRTPKGEGMDIARFARREDAVDGLMAASRALEDAHGRIRSPSAEIISTQSFAAPRKKGKWRSVFIGLLLLLVLFVVWAMLSTRPLQGLDEGSMETDSGVSAESGVPLSADQFLQQP
ncbi:MAG: hypothetical protein K9G62_07190 [Alphaproteobacteria bacterium]|nr:hypothetical protein [Alphaproteobacteria bacterium]